MKKLDNLNTAEGILTEWKFYSQVKEKYPDAIIIMRYYAEYDILGKDADYVFPLLKEVLTHKDAGRMYCYDRENYSYSRFGFGLHNLDKVMTVLVSSGHKVIISHYNDAFKKWGGYERVDRMIVEAEQARKAMQPKTWRQTTLFELENFV